MTESERELLNKHDVIISVFGDSIVEMKDALKETNQKLGVMTELISRQEVLMERLASIEHTFKDSITRAYQRIEKLETKHDNAVRSFEKQYAEKCIMVPEIDNRLDALEGSIRKVVLGVISTLITGMIYLLIKDKPF